MSTSQKERCINMIKILIVEDEKAISNLIEMNLSSSGYHCECIYDGLEAANKIEQNIYDLILLDIMLPGLNGFELMEYIREKDTPVIFITARQDAKDIVRGLKLGADDYIIKPFEIVVLLARIETVLRRCNKIENLLIEGDITIEMDSMQVKKNGRDIDLTAKEFNLLLLFVRNKNIALFRETLYEKVWESEYLGDTRTVDLHVLRLRKKLGWEHKIKAIYKVGYRLEM